MRIAIVTALIFGCTFAQAEAFLGGGLCLGNQTLSSEGHPSSKFSAQGYVIEGGLNSDLGRLSLEYGSTDAKNSLASDTFLEVGKLEYYSAKAGFKFDKIQFGGGYRHIENTLKSLSTTSPAGQLESKYSGWVPFGLLTYDFVSERNLRTSIEAQYVTGTLKAGDPALPDINFAETTISLRIFFGL